MGGPAYAPASKSGRGEGRQFGRIACLYPAQILLAGGWALLATLLVVGIPTVPLQCGHILLTSLICWYFGNRAARIVMMLSSSLLALSVWLHQLPWEAYLLAPMAFIAGEGMVRLRVRYLDAEMGANIDQLTGALTPRGFAEMLSRELGFARKQNRTTALIFLDLDRFKQVNDRYGHAEGDRVLNRVVAALREVLLEDDHVARVGGDEFLVFLRFADDRTRMDDFQHLLIQAIEGLPWGVSASAGGIVIRPQDNPEPRVLIQMADDLMYDVKRSGRGRLELHHLFELGSLGNDACLRPSEFDPRDTGSEALHRHATDGQVAQG